jgi:hypothetical protein
MQHHTPWQPCRPPRIHGVGRQPVAVPCRWVPHPCAHRVHRALAGPLQGHDVTPLRLRFVIFVLFWTTLHVCSIGAVCSLSTMGPPEQQRVARVEVVRRLCAGCVATYVSMRQLAIVFCGVCMLSVQ